jgi:DNA-binding beta-propeller fold protein YncE
MEYMSERSERVWFVDWGISVACRHSLALALVAIVALLAAPNARADLLVTSSGTDNVLRYSEATGDFIDEFVPSGSGGLHSPQGLTLGPDGNLYVVSTGPARVLRYDGGTGAFLDTFVPTGSGGLTTPFDLGFGPDGNLYVAEAGQTGEVLRYDGMTGAFIDVFASGGTPALNTPRALAFGTGVLFASGEGDRIWKFDSTTGAFVGTVQSDNPRGLTLGPLGNLYEATLFSGIFRRNPATGVFINEIVGGPVPGFGIAAGRDCNLYMASGNSVLRFNAATGALDPFVASGSGGLQGARFLVFFTPRCE